MCWFQKSNFVFIHSAQFYRSVYMCWCCLYKIWISSGKSWWHYVYTRKTQPCGCADKERQRVIRGSAVDTLQWSSNPSIQNFCIVTVFIDNSWMRNGGVLIIFENCTNYFEQFWIWNDLVSFMLWYYCTPIFLSTIWTYFNNHVVNCGTIRTTVNSKLKFRE